MKAAVPMYDDDVAPRFGFADKFLVGDIFGHQVTDCREVTTTTQGLREKLEEIRNLGIDFLLCCGFNRHFIPLSETLGIRVITGLTGQGRDVLERFARGEIVQPRRKWGRCAGRRKGFGGGRRGRCR